jgi:hypothetical protein
MVRVGKSLAARYGADMNAWDILKPGPVLVTLSWVPSETNAPVPHIRTRFGTDSLDKATQVLNFLKDKLCASLNARGYAGIDSQAVSANIADIAAALEESNASIRENAGGLGIFPPHAPKALDDFAARWSDKRCKPSGAPVVKKITKKDEKPVSLADLEALAALTDETPATVETPAN